jgi:hypothetical protein
MVPWLNWLAIEFGLSMQKWVGEEEVSGDERRKAKK